MACTLWSSVCAINRASVETRRLPFNFDNDAGRAKTQPITEPREETQQFVMILAQMAKLIKYRDVKNMFSHRFLLF